jgi:PASTA domain
VRRAFFTPAVTVAFVSTLLLLSIVGWSAGWVAAGNELERQGHVDPTTSAQPTKAPTSSPSPVRSSAPTSPKQSNTPTATPSRPDQFAMPNLVNQNFQLARAAAREKKLGVNVSFNEPSSKADGMVARTFPDAGVFVWPGVTIQLYVAGPAPEVLVPQVVDKPCGEGKDAILEAGLKIQAYPSGERGNVTKVEPVPGTKLKWNDEVKLFCS